MANCSGIEYTLIVFATSTRAHTKLLTSIRLHIQDYVVRLVCHSYRSALFLRWRPTLSTLLVSTLVKVKLSDGIMRAGEHKDSNLRLQIAMLQVQAIDTFLNDLVDAAPHLRSLVLKGVIHEEVSLRATHRFTHLTSLGINHRHKPDSNASAHVTYHDIVAFSRMHSLAQLVVHVHYVVVPEDASRLKFCSLRTVGLYGMPDKIGAVLELLHPTELQTIANYLRSAEEATLHDYQSLFRSFIFPTSLDLTLHGPLKSQDMPVGLNARFLLVPLLTCRKLKNLTLKLSITYSPAPAPITMDDSDLFYGPSVARAHRVLLELHSRSLRDTDYSWLRCLQHPLPEAREFDTMCKCKYTFLCVR
ncbi:hypothetical protein NEOLEDRAFT_116117 [Neolentinus lepideus HHB14362 ss-1]|uniref:F-box domain-containing protein n=1 Tax=Neolentinus lepideus HHB14362 ss-1 TaxID=1314782 RepID=A0A165MUF7_9AGAM|nr:hypothetical protein NEOLEDRAFT_116117 [Neolentinus lepideus HHB14362 ss-1]